jgi:Cys-tRNA(Pro)/Cys-tRNA(Cys) deacylase
VVAVTEKTNAMRLLEQAGIPFEVRKYAYEEDNLSAEKAADALGMPHERVFKTLVLRGERRGVLLALVPAGTEIDLKRLAQAAKDKRVEMVPLIEVRKLTGYERGAVTPLALSKNYSVVIDETVELWPSVGISAGVRGVEIVLAPGDLLQITSAETADIARSS